MACVITVDVEADLVSVEYAVLPVRQLQCSIYPDRKVGELQQVYQMPMARSNAMMLIRVEVLNQFRYFGSFVASRPSEGS
jgi:hypothetical protein